MIPKCLNLILLKCFNSIKILSKSESGMSKASIHAWLVSEWITSDICVSFALTAKKRGVAVQGLNVQIWGPPQELPEQGAHGGLAQSPSWWLSTLPFFFLCPIERYCSEIKWKWDYIKGNGENKSSWLAEGVAMGEVLSFCAGKDVLFYRGSKNGKGTVLSKLSGGRGGQWKINNKSI